MNGKVFRLSTNACLQNKPMQFYITFHIAKIYNLFKLLRWEIIS